MRFLLVAGLVGSFLFSSFAGEDLENADFTIHRKLAMTKKADEFDGSLEIWRDKRLTDADLKAMQEHDSDFDPTDGARFKAIPVRPAVVRLRSENGQLIQSIALEKPAADLEARNIGMKDKRVFLVTQDFGMGMGSYNGPVTRILEATPRSIAWMETLDLRTGKKIRISLMRSLKSSWNFAPVKTGGVEEILEARCYPDETPEGFRTSFSRYHYGQRGWVTVERTEPRLWESEGGDGRLGYSLPALKKFPAYIE